MLRALTVFLALFLCFSHHSFSQKKIKTRQAKTYYDSKKKHINEVYLVRKKDPAIKEGAYTKLLNNIIIIKGQHINNLREGEWKHFYKEGNVNFKGHYVNDKQEGEWLYYYPDGALSAKVYFKNGLPEGEWTGYYKSGERASTYFYKNGFPTRSIIYATNGKVMEENTYDAEGEVKTYTEYNEDGLALKKYEYKGKLLITYQVFSNKGHKYPNEITEGNGVWENYTDNGRKLGEVNYKDGLKHGKATRWWSNAILRTEGMYENGEKTGQWEYYSKEGIKLSRAEYAKYEQDFFSDENQLSPKYFLGENKYMEFISVNVNYPAYAVENNIAGTVYLQVKIKINGFIEDVHVEEGVHESLDNESLRVVKQLPYFTPMLYYGVPMPSKINLPIKYQLE